MNDKVKDPKIMKNPWMKEEMDQDLREVDEFDNLSEFCAKLSPHHSREGCERVVRDLGQVCSWRDVHCLRQPTFSLAGTSFRLTPKHTQI